MGVVQSFLGIFGSLLGGSLGSKTEEEKQYFLVQTRLLGQQNTYFNNYVENKRFYSMIRAFIVPIIFVIVVIYLIYKKKL